MRLRNRDDLCGFDGCEYKHTFDCTKCGGRFCLRHLSDELYPAMGSRGDAEMAIVCAHCWERRTIWSKP